MVQLVEHLPSMQNVASLVHHASQRAEESLANVRTLSRARLKNRRQVQ